MGNKDIYSSTLRGVQTVNNGERYRAPNKKESFGPVDTRPGWMQTSDAVRKNIDRFGSATPSFSQLTFDAVGIGTDKSGKSKVDPVGLALGFFPAGKVLGPLGKVTKALTPKSARIANAASRLYRESHRMDGALGKSSYEIRKNVKASEDAYSAAKSKAYRDLGYRPGEAIDNMRSGTDAYSGSSYRIGRGIPRIGMSKPLTSEAEYMARGLERQSEKALWKKGFSGIESDLKTRLRTRRGR
jgi:hypothetical protein